MEVVAINGMTADGFSVLLHTKKSPFEIDLSNSTLVEVIKANIAFKNKKKEGSGDKFSALIHNLLLVEEKYDHTFTPDEVTDLFYDAFKQFLLAGDEETGRKPVRLSTISTYFAQLRSSLAWASKHRCPLSATFNECKVEKYECQKEALTQDQVSHIYHFDINTLKCRPQLKRTYEKVRDQFVLSCNLGQRISDMVRINPSNFSEDFSRYTVVQQKTGTKAVVPIITMTLDRDVTREILKKYNYYSPLYDPKKGRVTGKTHYNMHLHNLLRLIGGEFVNNMAIIQNKINGQIVTEEQPLYKAITSHTGRRTFITTNIRRSVAEHKIRRCSGHKDFRAFNKYICLKEEDF